MEEDESGLRRGRPSHRYVRHDASWSSRGAGEDRARRDDAPLPVSGVVLTRLCRFVRRVVVTGLGAITPIGNDAPSTWRAAVAGESGIDFIRSFDASGFPVRLAAEVKDFDPSGVASPKEARKLDRNVLLALGAAREAVEDAG